MFHWQQSELFQNALEAKAVKPSLIRVFFERKPLEAQLFMHLVILLRYCTSKKLLVFASSYIARMSNNFALKNVMSR